MTTSSILEWPQIEQRIARATPKSFREKPEGFLLGTKAVIGELQTQGTEISRAALDQWWKQLILKLGAGNIGTKANAAELFLDLGTGPAGFSQSTQDTNAIISRRESANSSDIPGLRVDQRVFLFPNEFTNEHDALDRVSKQFVEDPAVDGVHLLAGVRGSGKSTFLNRVAYWAKTYVPTKRNTAPLLVRVDLGSTFEERKFTIDLASQICQDAKLRLLKAPYCNNTWTRWAATSIGHFGRWCSVNIGWAIGAILVSIVFSGALAIDEIMGKAAPASSKEVPSSPLSNLPTSKGILFVLGCVLFIGFAYSAWSSHANTRWMKRFGNKQNLLAAMFFFVIPLLCCFVTLELSHVIFPYVKPASAAAVGNAVSNANDLDVKIDSAIHFALFSLSLVAGVVISFIFLPSWWNDYITYRKLFLTLRARQDETSPDLPYFTSLTTLVRAVLPHGNDSDRIEDLSVPFLQDQLKDILKKCVKTFGHVVILLDDVDVLSSDKFPEFFRIIRPISKVTGVRCLVSVPAYFYFQFNSHVISDLHSTVRNVYFLGNPDIFHGAEEFFVSKKLTAAVWTEFISKLLESRLRVRVVPAIAGDPVPRPGPIGFTMAPWRELLKDPKFLNNTIPDFLNSVGQSRRELIREIERTLRETADSGTRTGYSPMLSTQEASRSKSSDVANNKKTEYFRVEKALTTAHPGPKEPIDVAVDLKNLPLSLNINRKLAS
ncbi:MAG: hypothetical protein HY286_05010 [Planctomycetes bacterium]|nr:hypothetical protein [Planctomycetota bacterium]